MQQIIKKPPFETEKEVSKLNLIKRILGVIAFSIAILILATNFSISASLSNQSDSDVIDQDFNIQIQTNSFGAKSVEVIKVLPDDKILVSGAFNTFNGQPVSGLVRLDPNGNLDPTFNNNLLAANSSVPGILPLNDGKILIGGSRLILNGQTEPTKTFLRLNADGSIDPTFNCTMTPAAFWAVDPTGRILLSGSFQVIEDGVSVSRFLIRLNEDGSHDSTFRFHSSVSVERFAIQNNKIIIANIASSKHNVYRINEDGSTDNSFLLTSLENYSFRQLLVQPDNKILVLTDTQLLRLDENGGKDAGFQVKNFPREPKEAHLSNDGRIIVSYGDSPAQGFIFNRLMPNGAADPSYSVFTYKISLLSSQALQADGSILIGDMILGGFNANFSTNGFIRLTPNGIIDSGFNPGGTGFLTISPGYVRSMAVQTDNKILIGGIFDTVNGNFRSKMARLNPDTTLDTTFQIKTSGPGNYFSLFSEIFNISQQTDGKLVITGSFTYFINGVQRYNIARLNSDGSIDSSFFPPGDIVDRLSSPNGGSNRFVFQTDGKIVVGGSHNKNTGAPLTLRLNTNGSLDNTFNSPSYTLQEVAFIMDVAIQPDGKILIGGRHEVPNISGSVRKTFLTRLNSDGSIDQSFQFPEEFSKEVSTFKLLPNGKVLVAKLGYTNPGTVQSSLHRFNSNGSADNSFEADIEANGKISALLVLPNGKLMVGGKFSTFKGEPRTNLVKLNENGSLDPTVYAANEEILTLVLDNEKRILVGGKFTTIGIGVQNQARSYAARLVESTQQTTNITPFDFDGDGRADYSIFRPSAGEWWYLRSGDGGNRAFRFGNSTDKIVPADYTGDGKTDIAFFRPSTNEWFVLRSEDSSFYSAPFGAAGDIPAPADYDGDGKADLAVFRPSEGNWYINRSTGGFTIVQFGATGDIPVAADYDGDAKADLAIFRPTFGEWWYLRSSDGGNRAFQFGSPTDKPVPADYTGDGKTDPAFYRPSTSEWFVLRSENGSFYSAPFGAAGDVPVPADYDGDGKADLAVWRSTDTNWYIAKTTGGFSIAPFGAADDRPVPAPSN